jgi:hypothetical protein
MSSSASRQNDSMAFVVGLKFTQTQLHKCYEMFSIKENVEFKIESS